MKKILIVAFALVSLATSAQFYPMETGTLGGFSSGIQFRAYLEEELSYEALLSFRNKGVQGSIFRQMHQEIGMTKDGSFHFLYGYGAHVGYYYSDSYKIFYKDVYFGRELFTPVLGADAYAGIEYRFFEYPFSIGINYTPYMEMSLRQIFGVNLWDFGFSIKYRFNSNKGYYAQQ